MTINIRQLEREHYGPPRQGYDNINPIANARTALRLLSNPWSGRWADAQLKTYSWKEPHIEVMFEGREYSGGSSRHYLVDPTCAAELKRNGWVHGLLYPGYTSKDEFRISKQGTAQLIAWAQQDEDDAKALLIPGEHGWSSIYNYVGLHRLRDSDREGHVFRNPADEYFIVFLQEKAVENIRRAQLYI